MCCKLVRPEFQAFLEDEQSILTLVKDVADVLENIAANSTHTPALYAAFLRALISAKLAPQQQQQRLVDSRLKQDQGNDSGATLGLYESPSTVDVGSSSTGVVVRHPTTSISPSRLDDGSHSMPLPAPPPPAAVVEEPGSGYFQHAYYMNEFQFESEMGPATDITTFPPTMAVPSQPPHSGEEGGEGGGGGGMMAMENILSSGFWDNMVVPGARFSLSSSFSL